MIPDWTPRERQLRAALWEYRQCQRRMLDLWSDSDQHGKEILWRNLHRCEALADTALSTPPPPDPRDEALDEITKTLQSGLDDLDGCEIDPSKYNDDSVRNLNSGYVGLFQTVESALAAIAAVKGGE